MSDEVGPVALHCSVSGLFVRRTVRRTFVAMCAVCCMGAPLACWGNQDVFGTERSVTLSRPGPLASAEECDLPALDQPLLLQEAVERALCASPTAWEAWANVRLGAAGVGIAKAAYLPTLSGTLQGIRDHSQTHVVGRPDLSSANTENQQSENLSLTWVLYDFGGRRAAMDSAAALFTAVQASQDAVLQSIFAAVIKDYYAAQAANGSLQAARDVEATAKDAFDAARERVVNGVAPMSDELQAQTAYAQAVVSTAKAYGDLQIAVGTLANDMALAPQSPIRLPPVDDDPVSPEVLENAVDGLIDAATRDHPSVLAAKAQVAAADAKARQVRAQGLPAISLVGRDAMNNQAVSPSVGSRPLPASGRDAYIGIQVSLPLFEGWARTYQVRQAQMQSDVQRAVLEQTTRKVGLDVWSTYQNLRTANGNITNSALLLSVARRSYDATERRYRAGVGGILDLLNAQASLAGARRQRIIALTDWRNARLQLAGALGRLEIWSLPAAEGK